MNSTKFQIELNADLVWRLVLLFAAICVILTSAEAAFAAAAPAAEDNDVVGQTLCRLVANLSGGIARGIATIAIFSVGVGLFLGKLNWGIAAATAAGVGIIFSAPRLVAFLSGDADNATCDVGD
ncbi:Type IV secretion system protein VirB2 [Candidatus Megaera venefica]|uniref:Type IV secretion system protein VirB2 n=1 Tax=Candidatus Megaera venefica TaxID=2055910 RepID=A0ABU5NAW3_9RICK|nr:TrbC/VirB2 family protein [Candidatus Megaera venefica]MBY0533456.1 TrbC/VirB2 family protein [Rickettsiaceae bacterium]MEA0970299.1 Type IV secretion system protein VirB2 [Candidatus Megaera venefica]